MISRIAGVILAAGKASRIHPLSTHTPKALLSVGNKPLIAYQIEQMREAGVDRVFVVIGSLGEQIVEALGDGAGLGVRITYVSQTEQLGIAHALSKVSGLVDCPFFLFLGDFYNVFADETDLNDVLALFEKGSANAVLTTKEETDGELIRRNFAVVESDGRVVQVVEKPRDELPSMVRGCGVYLFDPSIFESIAATPKSAVRGEYEITDSIQTLIDSGATVRSMQLVDWDVNITFPADLLRCNLHHLKALDQDRLVGEGSLVHAGCEIRNSVVGHRVIVREGIRIHDSVILSDVQVEGSQNIVRSIVGPAGTIACDQLPAL